MTHPRQRHTELPWRVEKNGSSRILACPKDFVPSDIRPEYTVDQVGVYVSPKSEEQRENAAFIVRAVNSHYELIDVLEKCLKKVEGCCNCLEGHKELEEAQEALKKAKE